MINEVIERALMISGSSKALATDLEVSPSDLTRFRSGENGMKIDKLAKLFEISGMVLIEKEREEKLIDAALVFADLYKSKK